MATKNIPGALCFAEFAPGSGDEWMVMREDGNRKTATQYVVYLNRTERHRTESFSEAHGIVRRVCPAPGPDLESSMSR